MRGDLAPLRLAARQRRVVARRAQRALASTLPFAGVSALLLAAVSALLFAAAPAAAESARERVQADVRILIEALYAGDASTVLGFTHPLVLREMGGEVAARASVEQALAQISLLDLKLESLRFPSKPDLMKGEGREFAIVPTLVVLRAGEQRVESLNFQLGVKEPDTSSWKYLEGSEIDQQKVQMLFPGFPVHYEFPQIRRKRL